MAYTGQLLPNLIIPFASSLNSECQQAIKTLSLPNLSRFLKASSLVHTDLGDEFDFIPPHERAMKRFQALMKPDVTWETFIVVTPCHWQVGIDHIRMDNPAELELLDDESKTLFETIRPYFLEDGITLTYATPWRWLAKSPVFEGLELASLDRVIGRNVDVWQPQTEASKTIRRLQNEMQMLLYTHPINEAREARGLPTVNSFWLSTKKTAVGILTDLHRYSNLGSLSSSVFSSDWQAWVAEWQSIDRKLSHAEKITLCGERHARTFAIPDKGSFTSSVKQLFKPAPSIQSVLASL